MKINKTLHLTYCSNIFKGNNWEKIFLNIKTYIPKIKKNITNKKFALGLCLSNSITNELLLKKNINIFIKWMKNENIYIPSINGFVYKNFHIKKIKENIYFPDWSSNKRLNYTKKLIKVLIKLIPKYIDGNISTSPISYKPWVENKNKTYIYYKSSINLAKTIIFIIKNKRFIHIDIEPEPICSIENTKEVIIFFKNWLIPIGSYYLEKKLKLPKFFCEKIIKKYIRICFDICHLSVEFEDILNSILKLKKNNIKIGKIQISSSPKLTINNINKNIIIKNNLNTFNNSNFLHQVIKKRENKLIYYNDITDLLKNFNLELNDEIRIHFHLPIYMKTYKIFYTTQDNIIKVISFLKNKNITNCIEIETYTFSNILTNISTIDSIIKEYNWLLNLYKK